MGVYETKVCHFLPLLVIAYAITVIGIALIKKGPGDAGPFCGSGT